MINPQLLVFLIGAIILLSIIVVSLVISYGASLKRLKKLQENEDALYKKTIEEEKNIVEQAQTDYQGIIKAADEKAKEILNQSAQINQTSEKELNDAVAGLAEKEKNEINARSQILLKQYEEQIAQINDNSINNLKNISEDIKTSVISHFDELKKLMSEQTFESKKAAEEKIKVEYDELEKELQNYKQKQLQEVDQKIYQIIFNVSKAAIGKGLSMDQHQELILDALERAKNEGGL